MENLQENLEQTEEIKQQEGILTVNPPEVKTEEISFAGQEKGLSKRRRILQGRVVSNKPDKTIIVKIERYVQHPIYKKYFKRSKKVMAHDEENQCQVGDLVRVMEWRPLSRRKRWMLVEIVERAK